MNTIRKLLFFVLLFFALIPSHTWAEEKKSGLVDSSVRILNDAGNNDGLQEVVSRAGGGIAKGGQGLVDQAIKHGLKNPNIPGSKVDSMVKTGVRIFVNGKVIENAAKVAPHVGWIASTAGKLDAGDRTGAAITATNGLGRTVIVGWVAGTLGTAAAGAVAVGGTVAAAPVALGVAVGVGVAVAGGIIWDSTIGYGFDALDQNIHDIQAKELYGSTKGSAPTRKEYLEYLNRRRQVEKDKKQEEDRKKEKADDRERQDRTRENRMQEKYEDEKQRVYEARQARERELDTQEKAGEARERLREKLVESKKEERERREKREEKKQLTQKEKSYKDMSAEERRKALKRNDDEAWEALQKDLLGESLDEDIEEGKNQSKNDDQLEIPPVRIVATVSFSEDYSAGKFRNIVTTTTTLSFWNVGNQVVGYGGATLKQSIVSSFNGSNIETNCKGTFSGGPNGVIHLYGVCSGSTLKVNGGGSVSGGGMTFTISNPSAFKYWDN